MSGEHRLTALHNYRECLRALTVEAMDEWNTTLIEAMDERNVPSVVDVDTATIVSIGSSCVILISGCIAVVCLILYMKKSEQQMQRFRQSPHSLSVCAKCGATVALTPHLESKRSIGVITEAILDDNRIQSTTVTERQTNESALYAISGANFETISEEKSVPEDSLLGIICGHISDAQTTIYSTNCNDIHLKTDNRLQSGLRQLRSCSHSQCSSNQDSELMRAYEISRQRCAPKLSFESFDIYESIGSDDRETPTDPGIREFTKSPPKPNERRQGVVQRLNENDSETTSSPSTTPTNESYEQHFGAIPRYRSRKPMWKLSSQSETIKCLSSLTTNDFEINGLSSDDSDEDFSPGLKKQQIDC